MAVTIEEGWLVELPMPEASDTERRALGEFAGPGGEPASCAIGSTTGAEPHVAHDDRHRRRRRASRARSAVAIEGVQQRHARAARRMISRSAATAPSMIARARS